MPAKCALELAKSRANESRESSERHDDGGARIARGVARQVLVAFRGSGFVARVCVEVGNVAALTRA